MPEIDIIAAGSLPLRREFKTFPTRNILIGEPDFDYWTSDWRKYRPSAPARAHFLNQARRNLCPAQGSYPFL